MLSNDEKIVINEFLQTRIPLTYKCDDTDNILYIEHVDFDLCDMLLKNRKASNEYVQDELKNFAKFLTQLNIKSYDDDKKYLYLLFEVVNIFITNNL